MATYAFETITADQARNIRTGDYLTFDGGPARDARVTYLPATHTDPALIQVSFGGRTVVFGPDLSALTLRGGLEMADHSRLLIGDESRQLLTGGAGHDGIFAGAGDDTVHGGAGDDRVQGNAGNDTLYGDAGSNTIYGGQGDDSIVLSTYGEARGSWAHGNQGNDEIIGGQGNDTLLGGQGNDFLGGSDGHDYLSGDLGDDELFGGDGNDTLVGGAGNDTLNSGGGHDLVQGGDGDDQLVVYMLGGSTLDGGAGNDTIVSASVDMDVLKGGEGRDVFEFATKAKPAFGHDDQILDWNGADDHFRFAQVSALEILPRQYSEFVAETYEQAHAIADEHISATGAIWVAAQVGQNVYVFAETNGNPADGADVGVVLVGKTLSDISLLNFE